MVSQWIQWIFAAMIAVSLTNCAGDQQQDEMVQGEEGYDDGGDEDYAAGEDQEGGNGENYGDEGNGGNEGNEGGITARATGNEGGNGENYGNEGGGEGEGEGNNAYAENGAEGGNNYATQEGEGMNNALENDTQQGNSALQNTGQDPMANEGETMNNATENEFAGEQPPPMEEQPAIDAGSDEGAEMAAADSMAPVAAPMPGGKVMYVRSMVTLYTSPGGAAAGTLDRGDHPLVWTAESMAMAGGGDMAMMDQGMPMEGQMGQEGMPMEGQMGQEGMPMNAAADGGAAYGEQAADDAGGAGAGADAGGSYAY